MVENSVYAVTFKSEGALEAAKTSRVEGATGKLSPY